MTHGFGDGQVRVRDADCNVDSQRRIADLPRGGHLNGAFDVARGQYYWQKIESLIVRAGY